MDRLRPADRSILEVDRGFRLAASPFDWPSWTSEIRARDQDPLDPALMASFSPADLRRYLTMLNRIERFTEGTWQAALESGAFDAILDRLLQVDSDGGGFGHLAPIIGSTFAVASHLRARFTRGK
jgi:Family of unknown function (DUF6508)